MTIIDSAGAWNINIVLHMTDNEKKAWIPKIYTIFPILKSHIQIVSERFWVQQKQRGVNLKDLHCIFDFKTSYTNSIQIKSIRKRGPKKNRPYNTVPVGRPAGA